MELLDNFELMLHTNHTLGIPTTEIKSTDPVYLKCSKYQSKTLALSNIMDISKISEMNLVKPKEENMSSSTNYSNKSTSNLKPSAITLGEPIRSTRSTQVVKPQVSYLILVQQQIKMWGNATNLLLPKHWKNHVLSSKLPQIKAYSI